MWAVLFVVAVAKIKKDSMGEIEVPDDKIWGAQTQRSLGNFPISNDIMPLEVVYGLARLKQAAAFVNKGTIGKERSEGIQAAADEVLAGKWDDNFPLKVWQTGSGTQSNMNVNEVLAGRGTEIGGVAVHPNDHVNLGQSSNDIFPSAMHVATHMSVHERLLPSLTNLITALEAKAKKYADIVKIGRTHLQDAVPLTVGDEMQTWAEQLKYAKKMIEQANEHLAVLPLGGTAVGTGLNAPKNFAADVTAYLRKKTPYNFTGNAHPFQSIAGHDEMVQMSGALNTLATASMKIANDVRLLGSGPRAGLGELILPANEPGSSIMPGKVNPTQAEALTMVSAQVMGNHVAVTIGGATGHMQLNAFKPLIVFNVLKSVALLGDSLQSFNDRCIDGLTVDEKAVQRHVENSLMLVTALAPHIGYDQAAHIAHTANHDGSTLREASYAAGVTEENFNKWIVPKVMAKPHKAEL